MKKQFHESSLGFIALLMAFEQIGQKDIIQTLAISQKHIMKYKEIFEDPALNSAVSSPNKMLYDTVRILGLKIIGKINIGLIKLQKTPSDPAIKREVVTQLANLCFDQMLIKNKADSHSVYNIQYLQQTTQMFSQTISAA